MRVTVSVGSHKVARVSDDRRRHDDFPGSESDELLAAARAVDVEGRMDGDARGREIAACAAVGGEMPTGFRRTVIRV